jgi:transcriptional regulator with XRE-family HTH domain
LSVSWAKFVEQLLQIKGWTAQELASRLHIQEPAVSKWRSERTIPSAKMQQLLLILGGLKRRKRAPKEAAPSV